MKRLLIFAGILLLTTLILLRKNVPPQFLPGSLAHLEKQLMPKGREPSSVFADNRCFFDRFDGSDQEIEYFEKNSFSLPANMRGDKKRIYSYFKLRVGEYVHADLMASFNSCTDVPCFYKAVYGDEKRARQSYLLFLMTAMAPAASDKIPGISIESSVSKSDLTAYLFTESELTMLLQATASVLHENYKVFPQERLQTIHKAPQSNFEGTSKDNACGFANGSYIVLRSDCLVSDWTKKHISVPTNGNYYLLVQGIQMYLHELGHCVDFNNRRQVFPDDFDYSEISHSKQWKSFGTPIAPSADGIIHFDFHTPKQGFITGYGSTSYHEDFAESFAYFRFMPEDVKIKIPDKSEFLKKYIFNNTGFTQEDLKERFSAEALANVYALSLDDLDKCLGIPENGQKPQMFRTGQNLTEPELACYEDKISSVINKVYSQGLSTDPHFCLMKPANWISGVVNSNREEIQQFVFSSKSSIDIKNLRAEIAAGIDAREAYVSLWKQPEAKTQYDLVLQNYFSGFRARIETLNSITYDAELKAFMARNEFETVKKNVEDLVANALDNNLNNFQTILKNTTDTCIANTNSPTPTELFRQIDYKPVVRTEFLGCIEAQEAQALVTLVTNILGAQAIGTNSQNVFDYTLAKAKIHSHELANRWYEAERLKLESSFKGLINSKASVLGRKYQALNIAESSFLTRYENCRFGVRRIFYDEIYKGLKLNAMADYSMRLIDEEEKFCGRNVVLNQAFQLEAETWQNKLSRRVFTLATQSDAANFPIDGNFAKYEIVGLKKEACLEKVRGLVAQDKELTAHRKDRFKNPYVNNAIEETCLNGRYSGRFMWTRSPRYETFGNTKVLGKAKFLTTEPAGNERRVYLFALRRYLGYRTNKLLEAKH